jgi:signal transduction histidine kinase
MKLMMFVRIIIISLLSLLFILRSNANEIDSLEQVIDGQSGMHKVDTYLLLIHQLNQNDPYRAINHGKKALALAEENDYPRHKAIILNELGMAYSIIGKHREAIASYKSSHGILVDFASELELGKSLYDLGSIYFDISDYQQSLKYYQDALKHFEVLNQDTLEKIDIIIIANTYKAIGSLYDEQGDYDKALMYLENSLKTNHKIGNAEGCITCFLGIGGVYQKLNSYEEALKNRLEAVNLSESIGHKYFKGLSMQNTGESYASLDKFNLAIDYYEQGLSLLLEVDNKKQIAETYCHMADAVLTKEKNTDKAIDFYEKGLEIAQEGKFKYLEYKIYQKLYEVYKARRDFRSAFWYYQLFTEVKDSLFNIEKSKQINTLEIKFQTAKKDTEIEILKKDNEIQQNFLWFSIIVSSLVLLLVIFIYLRYRSKRKTNILLGKKNEEIEAANKELTHQNRLISDQKEQLSLLFDELKQSESLLREANGAKDKFFSIIAHDLKNPFNVLLNYSQILLEGFENLSDEQRIKYIEDIQTSTKSLVKLTENLLDWSRSQTGRIKHEPQEIDLYELAFNNVYLFKKAAEEKNITIKSEIEYETNVYADFNMVNTVFRNLISNAVKFTEEGGEIKTTAQDKGDLWELCVSDTGMGIKEENLEKLFKIDESHSTRGTRNEEGTGLGLILCKEFVEKNGGEIRVESKVGEWTKFIFTLPKAK